MDTELTNNTLDSARYVLEANRPSADSHYTKDSLFALGVVETTSAVLGLDSEVERTLISHALLGFDIFA